MGTRFDSNSFFDWLRYCHYNAQNCILADEMGLGKTVQTITFLSQVYKYGVIVYHGIAAVHSSMTNWMTPTTHSQKSFLRFASTTQVSSIRLHSIRMTMKSLPQDLRRIPAKMVMELRMAKNVGNTMSTSTPSGLILSPKTTQRKKFSDINFIFRS